MGDKLGSLPYERQNLREFENRHTLASKNCIMRSFIIVTICQILQGR